MQLELIERPTPSRSAERRRAMADARARGEAGMGMVAADKADRENPGWCEAACEALRKLAAAHCGMFTVEHARLVLAPELPKVHDERAWGKVTTMALKRGYIERVKGQFFPAASSNGAVRAVYRKRPQA